MDLGSIEAKSKSVHNRSPGAVWDCGSSLYDSFELKSFEDQLDSAIKAASRSMSMPHLPRRVVIPVLAQVPERRRWAIARQVAKAVRSVIGKRMAGRRQHYGATATLEGGLAVIPEVEETPEVRRTESERFISIKRFF